LNDDAKIHLFSLTLRIVFLAQRNSTQPLAVWRCSQQEKNKLVCGTLAAFAFILLFGQFDKIPYYNPKDDYANDSNKVCGIGK
jgi:hypothetical protein